MAALWWLREEIFERAFDSAGSAPGGSLGPAAAPTEGRNACGLAPVPEAPTSLARLQECDIAGDGRQARQSSILARCGSAFVHCARKPRSESHTGHEGMRARAR